MNLNEYVDTAVEIMLDDDYSADPKLRDLTGEVVRAAAVVLYTQALAKGPNPAPNAHEIRAMAQRGWETYNDEMEIADIHKDKLVSALIEEGIPNYLREQVRRELGVNQIQTWLKTGWDVVVPSGYDSDSLVESIVAFRPM